MAFYQCPKCKKVWQYPIEKCPECFLNLERVKSEKIKVIGVSKVNIPTLFHPKVPYFVLVLEDENGNKWVQKSVKEYKIGDEFHVTRKGNVTLSSVAIWRIKYDILEGIEKVIELLGGLTPTPEFGVGAQTKILILPTLNAPVHPHLAENTSPQFLERTIKYLIEKGAKSGNIKVAGQSFDKIPIETSVQKSQLLKVCQDYKILPLDLAKTNFVKKTKNNFTFEISEEVFNSDLIINLPILKVGRASALENILKFLKKDSYPPAVLQPQPAHPKAEIIEKLGKVLPGYLTLADAQVVQKSNKFTAFLGLTLASFNPLNLDRVFAEICLLKKLPEHLKKVKIEDIPIVGRNIEEVQYEVEKH